MNTTGRTHRRLAGKTILVTRPAHQNGAFCQMLAEAGATALPWPLVEIGAPADTRPLADLIAHLDTFDLLVFNSPNAVWHALPAIASRGLPAQIRIAAIGARTAEKITEQGFPVHLFPARDFDSEALLALPELQSVAGLRVAILRGPAGRDLTRDTLTARGAEVRYVTVYERRPPPPERLAQLDACLRRSACDAITITSGEAFQTLWRHVSDAARAQLGHSLFIMGSRRIAELARAEGLRARMTVADDPSDEAMFAALIDALAAGR